LPEKEDLRDCPDAYSQETELNEVLERCNALRVSRWTMLHFGCAITDLLMAEVLLVAGYADPLTGLRTPATLIGVHLGTIGWLSLLMLGALYQFVPVITNTPLYSQRLPLYSLIAIVPGLAAMLAGFLALGGVSCLTTAWLPIGGSLVLTGFVLGPSISR
jgi:hypothetical protein